MNYKKLNISILLSVLALVLGILVNPLCVIILNFVVISMWIIPERKAENMQ